MKGDEVPSATTILKILNKPSLIGWSNFLGLTGRRVENVLEDSSVKGTLIHERIHAILNNHLIISIWSCHEEQLYTKRCIYHFLLWYKNHIIEPIATEESFVCDTFGGTVDFYGLVDGLYTIVDFKTSKKIRLNMFFQLALYCILLELDHRQVDQVGIVLVGDKSHGQMFITRDELRPYIEVANDLVKFFHEYYAISNMEPWHETIV